MSILASKRSAFTNIDGQNVPANRFPMLVIQNIFPCVLGLAFSRAGLSSLSPDDYLFSISIVSGASADIRSFLLLSILFAICLYRKPLKKRFVNITAHVNIFILLICQFITLLNLITIDNSYVSATAYCIGSLAGIMSLLYWLRRMREHQPAILIIFVSTARLLYDTIMIIWSFLPDLFPYILGISFTAAQLLCIKHARKYYLATAKILYSTNEHKFLGFDEKLQNAKFYILSIVACILLSIAHEILRSYPLNTAIELSSASLLVFYLIIALLLIGGSLLALRLHPFTLLLLNWTGIILLASFGYLLYTMIPANLGIGAVFILASNSLKNVFKWYLIVAFMSLGKRDPYVYGISIWLIFLTPRVFGNAMLVFADFAGVISTGVVDALISTLLSTSTLTMLMGIGTIFIARELGMAEESNASASPILVKLIGIDDATSPSKARELIMEESVEKMGRQFLLSDREMEIIKYYALGHTQVSIAEQLHISKTTVHAHIRHVYEKTNLHSRQDVIDYLKTYE